ncbi:MAG: VCBS repeat-containing protein [Planctomycetota bacterium]
MSSPLTSSPVDAARRTGSPPESGRAAAIVLILIALAVVAGGVFWLTGRGDTDGQDTGDARLNPMGLTSLLEENQRKNDPRQDGWETEALHGDAKNQLKLLGKVLSHPDEIAADKLTTIAADDYQSQSLRLGPLDKVFEDATFTVWRPQDGAQAGDLPGKGPSCLAALLEDLAEPLAGAHDIRVEFKPFQVEITEEHQRTRTYFEALADTEDGSHVITATWTCFWRRPAPEAPPLLLELVVEDYEEVAVRADGHRLFADCTEAVIGGTEAFQNDLRHDTNYWLRHISVQTAQGPLGHRGVALGDANGDGLEDLYVCQQGGLPNRLLLQNPDGTAREAAKDAGLDWLDNTRSALFIDFDNDGDQDLAIAAGPRLVFLSNDGEGHFEVRTQVEATTSLYSLAAADYNGDGFVDVYACANVERSGGTSGLPVPYHDANNGAPNLLVRNGGDWTFVEVTRTVGLDENNTRHSFAAEWEDYDNDGDLDLYVANDFGRNNLYRNDDGHFKDVAPEAGVEDLAAGMSVSWGDYNGDGWMDVYIGNMFSSAGQRIAYQRRLGRTRLELPSRRSTTSAGTHAVTRCSRTWATTRSAT